MITANEVNWHERITEFLASGMTITAFAQSQEFSVHQFKYHLYKDPRYTKDQRYTKPRGTDSGVTLIPIKVDHSSSETVRINGFNIDISESTGDAALAKVLSAIRRIS